ncbi:MAG: RHS repeat-associated core domain-containing protein [Acidimicrobiia bacterium]|nr:RHS repeat-associated core domain-containing protein [Acidimicrobiia bacterium]
MRGSDFGVNEWDDETGRYTETTTYDATAGEEVQIMVEYADASGDAKLVLAWIPPGGSGEPIPGQYLSPQYGLVTSQTGPDGKTTATGHDGRPEDRRAHSQTKDPGGLTLTTSRDFEDPGQGYQRRTKRTLPEGNTWTYAYYGDTETRDNPCTTANDPANQAGGLETRTGPDPDTGNAIVEETVYDAAGRTVATRVGSEDWTCRSYDDRGRVTEVEYPAYGGHNARTVTYDYAVNGNPLITSMTDTTGTITTKTDLLGRPIERTDVWGKTTTADYDQPGRKTQTTGPEGTQTFAYNAVGQLKTQTLDGDVIATVDYTASGRPKSYTYPDGSGNAGNGTYSDELGYDTLGRPDGLTWREPDADLITSDDLEYSLAGRVDEQDIDGTDPNSSGDNFFYDGAGRLTEAHVPSHEYHYEYDGNSNRTKLTDNGNDTTYSYDDTDRLTSTTESGMGTITYDAHGNTETLGAEDYTYDAANRHLTTDDGTTDVEYVRDATDQVVERKVDGTTVARYSGQAVLDATNTVIQTIIGLPGGVTLTTTSGGETWSYPNLRGETTAVADDSGTKQGTTRNYSPYGRSLDTIPDNAEGNFDIGWTGQRFTEHEASLHTNIQMGARQYSPTLGRFLETDPVEGGSANDYEYCNGDPLNCSDYSGLASMGPINFREAAWCRGAWGTRASHCWRAYVTFGSLAIQTGSHFPRGQSNAVRHVIWSGLLYWYYGPCCMAQGFLDRHEWRQPRNTDY